MFYKKKKYSFYSCMPYGFYFPGVSNENVFSGSESGSELQMSWMLSIKKIMWAILSIFEALKRNSYYLRKTIIKKKKELRSVWKGYGLKAIGSRLNPKILEMFSDLLEQDSLRLFMWPTPNLHPCKFLPYFFAPVEVVSMIRS